MSFLRLESAALTETDKTIVELKRQLKERDKEIETMKPTIVKTQPVLEFVNSFDAPENLKTILKFSKTTT